MARKKRNTWRPSRLDRHERRGGRLVSARMQPPGTPPVDWLPDELPEMQWLCSMVVFHPWGEARDLRQETLRRLREPGSAQAHGLCPSAQGRCGVAPQSEAGLRTGPEIGGLQLQRLASACRTGRDGAAINVFRSASDS
jgi:hypothetical protein